MAKVGKEQQQQIHKRLIIRCTWHGIVGKTNQTHKHIANYGTRLGYFQSRGKK